MKIKIILILLLVSPLFKANATDLLVGQSIEITKFQSHNRYVPSGVTRPRFIIELNSKSMTAYQYSLYQQQLPIINSMRTAMSAKSPSESSHGMKIVQEQNAFHNALMTQTPNTYIQFTFSNLFNGMVIEADEDQIAIIAAMPEVKAVYPESFYRVQLDASHLRINSEAIWSQLSGRANAGRGIKVAVIDTGIRPENPMFADTGFTAPSSRPNNDYCATTDASFCNNKLIVARWSRPRFSVCNNEHLSPLGYDGHGTHVAGTAVGNEVSTAVNGSNVTLSGVAPGAYLMVYKALFVESSCKDAVASDAMLLEALENAVTDGANIINNSWGGGPGSNPNSSPYKTVFEAAEAAGVVVVSAAGNDGSAANTMGCPACVESGISVANSTTGRLYANSVDYLGNSYLAVKGSNTNISQNISGRIISALSVSASNFLGCSAFPSNSFNGAIALISRGICSFSDKATNAQNAGAIAMLVYNNTDSAPFGMFLPNITLPSFMLTQQAGQTIINAGSRNENGVITSAITRVIAPEVADKIADSSSRGPNGDASFLKPDLAAPGTDIYSSASPETDGASFGFKTGTSMASPHVAGSAALIKQLRPNWSALDIKSALMSSSKILQESDNGTLQQVSPFDAGAGLIDLNAASKTVLTFSKGSLTTDSCLTSCSFFGDVFNKSSQNTTWNLSATASQAKITVTPSTIEIPASGSVSFTVTVNVSQSPNNKWVFGNLLFSNGSLQDVHLPITVFASGSSDSSLLTMATTQENVREDQEANIVVNISNNRFNQPVDVTITAPDGTQIESENDVTLTINNAQQTDYSVNTNTGVINWKGGLDLPSITLTKTSTALPTISSITKATCLNGCDNTLITFTVNEFQYLGKAYSTVQLSENGVLIVGNGDASGIMNNVALPAAATPNNVLAPFWTDFDLFDGVSGDAGGGEIYAASINYDNKTWAVFEWSNAKLKDDNSNNDYSFAVWIRTGDNEEIIFNYIDIPNMPNSLSIGAENSLGTIGANYHHNGQGSSVTSNEKITLSGAASGTVQVAFNMSITEFNAGKNDSYSLFEDSSINMELLKNDNTDIKIASASISDGSHTEESRLQIPIIPNSGNKTLNITTNPIKGELKIENNNSVTYTPNEHYSGDDSFSYKLTDNAGETQSSADVAIKVNGVNDAPLLSAITAMNVAPSASVKVTANATDVDNETLFYTWTQTEGTKVSNLTLDGNSITFTSPNENTTIKFSVVAFDGSLNSAPQIVTITVANNSSSKSGGAVSFWPLLLLIAWIRFKLKTFNSDAT